MDGFSAVADRLRIDSFLHVGKDRINLVMINIDGKSGIAFIDGRKHKVCVNQIEPVCRKYILYGGTIMGITSLSDFMEDSDKGRCCCCMISEGLRTWLKAVLPL